MEGVEDLPEVVLPQELPWSWESFPEFLDFRGGRRYDMDIAAQVPHVGLICDASATTSMLTHWTRDRRRGERLPLGYVVRRLCRDNALALGLKDRGAIAPGLRADLNLIDYDRLNVRLPELVYDLPAGGKRLLQRADGYVATLLAGQVTYREGEPTAALPGRLIRS